MRAWLAAFGVYIGLAVGTVGAESLPVAEDLHADAAGAALRQAPILIFFMSDSCRYCEQVEDLYLGPMHAKGSYAGKLLIRVIHTESGGVLRDFDGGVTSHEAFARRERARFTPTVRLYSPAGAELAPALVGYASPDFYFGMLENTIETSIAKLRGVATQAKSVP